MASPAVWRVQRCDSARITRKSDTHTTEERPNRLDPSRRKISRKKTRPAMHHRTSTRYETVPIVAENTGRRKTNAIAAEKTRPTNPVAADTRSPSALASLNVAPDV